MRSVDAPIFRRGMTFHIFLLALLAIAPAVLADMPAIRDDLSEQDAARVSAVTAPATDFAKPEKFERMAGGAATSQAPADRNAFSHHSANLSFEAREDFFLGNGLFKKLWVTAPSSTQASDGLGPLYNARSCQRCHINDGRGRPPLNPGERSASMLLRLSVPPATPEEEKSLRDKTSLRIPEPTYGGQLQELALPGLKPEGRMVVTYTMETVNLNGGEVVELRRPTYSVEDLAYGEMQAGAMISPRIAPPMIGLGLLEAVHPADIIRRADPEDRDGNGISGRVSLVRDLSSGKLVPGRFGWKASLPTIMQQSAEAFASDIGISTPWMPDPFGDCTEKQSECRRHHTGVQPRLGDTEAPDPILDLVAFYSGNLAVPARRDVGEEDVLKGKEVFFRTGCSECHTPKFVTSRKAARPEHRFQLIWPYSDLLLHDMGEGLSDHRPVGDAAGAEWRTAPLWGIGLTRTVGGHGFFLHDGRARTLLEAILWHGGEAQKSRDKVVALSPDDRNFLIRFLESL